MTPRPDEYTAVCLDCDPQWPDSDLTREDDAPLSTAVHPFLTVADMETWITAHEQGTGHTAFWRTRRVLTRADRARQREARQWGHWYVQVCVDCHPEYAVDAVPVLDLVHALAVPGSPVQPLRSAMDCVVTAFAHHDYHEPAGHRRFRTELMDNTTPVTG
jgi:hypothetical protein